MVKEPKNPAAYIKRWPHLQTEELCLAALRKDKSSAKYIVDYTEAIQHYLVYCGASLYLQEVPNIKLSTICLLWNTPRFSRSRRSDVRYLTKVDESTWYDFISRYPAAIYYVQTLVSENVICAAITINCDVFNVVHKPTEKMIQLQKMIWEI